MEPLVHVYIPTYNAIEGKSDFFEKTINSIIFQSYTNYKIFISDDSSSDSTLDYIRNLNNDKIQILENSVKGSGVFENWNRCIDHALTFPLCEFITLFHQDDIYSSEILKKEVDYLSDHLKDAVFTEADYIDEYGYVLKSVSIPQILRNSEVTKQVVFKEIYTKGNSFFICPSAMFRKSVFVKTGKFSTHLPNSSDLEMWLRILFEGEGIGFILESLIQYRLQDSQASAKYQKTKTGLSDFFQVMQKYEGQVELSAQDKNSFLILKNLDMLQLELKNYSFGRGSLKQLKGVLHFLKKNSLRTLKKSLGVKDFLLVILCRRLFDFIPESKYSFVSKIILKRFNNF